MATNMFEIDRGEFGLSITDPGVPIADATIADYTDYSCQVINGVIVATANARTIAAIDTWCGTGEEMLRPQRTSFVLDFDLLQDPDIPTGLNAFAFDNDSGETGAPVYFYVGLASGAAPKAIGKCWVSPLDFGGPYATPLQASITWQCDGRPDVEHDLALDTP